MQVSKLKYVKITGIIKLYPQCKNIFIFSSLQSGLNTFIKKCTDSHCLVLFLRKMAV